LNIAFQAIVILLLVLPGVIFFKWSSAFRRFRVQRPIADDIFRSLVAAGFAHLLWVPFSNCVSYAIGLRADIQSALLLVAGRLGKQADSIEALEAVSKHPVAVLSYFTTLFAACALSGWICRRYVQWRHGAINALAKSAAPDEYQARRFAEWSRVLSFDITKDEVARVAVVASLVVGQKSFLYAGLLRNVLWNESSGEPEWLELSSPMRRPVDADEPDADGKDPWYDIEGESFMLRYSKVDTLNLIYSSLSEGNSSDDLSQSPNPPAPPETVQP